MLMKDLIDKYFHEGFRYKETVALLKKHHGMKVSLRALHRILRQANFYRKRKQNLLLEIVTFIQRELKGSGSCIDYKAMHQSCIRNGLMVSRVIVAQIMKHLGHIGVNTRRRGTLRHGLYDSPGERFLW